METERGKHGNKSLPIIVGGTNLYIEATLFPEKFWFPEADQPDDSEASAPISDELEALSNDELYRQLQQVDPARAAQLHPNEKRKVIRSLRVPTNIPPIGGGGGSSSEWGEYSYFALVDLQSNWPAAL